MEIDENEEELKKFEHMKEHLEEDYLRGIRSNLNYGQDKVIPETSLESAQIMIDKSPVTELMHETDKEIKLTKSGELEIYSITKHFTAYHDIMFIKREQHKKTFEMLNNKLYSKFRKIYPEVFEKENLINEIEKTLDKEDKLSSLGFDKCNLLRGGIMVATVNRGKDGFERQKQVETINTNTLKTEDVTEKKPSFLGNFFGGKKR